MKRGRGENEGEDDEPLAKRRAADATHRGLAVGTNTPTVRRGSVESASTQRLPTDTPEPSFEASGITVPEWLKRNRM